MITGSDSPLDCQKSYWDRVAATKKFTHTFPQEFFRKQIPMGSRILDFGCGYGRICAELTDIGYSNVVGVDISWGMIKCGHREHPHLNLVMVDSGRLPFRDASFHACTLMAVLTCIPTDTGQKKLIETLHNVLRPGGLLFLSDYPFQVDKRNRERYQRFKHEYGHFGVFRLDDGGVMRHHDMDWIKTLLSRFDVIDRWTTELSTMNGHRAQIFQILARKREKDSRGQGA